MSVDFLLFDDHPPFSYYIGDFRRRDSKRFCLKVFMYFIEDRNNVFKKIFFKKSPRKGSKLTEIGALQRRKYKRKDPSRFKNQRAEKEVFCAASLFAGK